MPMSLECTLSKFVCLGVIVTAMAFAGCTRNGSAEPGPATQAQFRRFEVS